MDCPKLWNEYFKSGRCIITKQIIRDWDTVPRHVPVQSDAERGIATWRMQLGWHKRSFKCHLEAIELHNNVCSHLGILTVQKEQMCSPAPEHIDKLHSSRRHYGTKRYFQFYKKLQVLTVITGVRHCIYCNQKYHTVAPILHITASGAWLVCPNGLLRVYSTMRSGFRSRISLPPPTTQLNSSLEVPSSTICFLGPSENLFNK